MITKKQNLSIIYFISRAMFLGIGFSLILKQTGKDAWLSIILGTIIGLFIIIPISKVLKYKKNRSLSDTLNDMKGLGLILRIVFIAFLIFLLYECILIVQTLTTSFFLFNTPPVLVGLSGAVLAIFTIKENDTTLFKVGEILFVVGIITAFITFSLLIPYIEIDAFLPVFTASFKNILIGALYYVAISTAPVLLALDFKDDGKHVVTTYIVSSFVLLCICFLIIGVLGPELIKIYRFPEYMVLKRIKFLDFIEKIENIISIIWILDAFMILATTTKTLKNVLPKKGAKITSSLILLVVTLITGLYFGSNYASVLVTYNLLPLILGIAILLILPTIFIFSCIKYRKKESS